SLWALIVEYAARVLVLSARVRVLFGFLPRFMFLAWLPLVLVSVVMLFGELLHLRQWLRDLSRFEHLPLVPAEPFEWLPFLLVAVVAAALSAAGQVAF